MCNMAAFRFVGFKTKEATVGCSDGGGRSGSGGDVFGDIREDDVVVNF